MIIRDNMMSEKSLTLEINDISNLNSMKSELFTLRDLCWIVKIESTEIRAGEKELQFYLQVNMRFVLVILICGSLFKLLKISISVLCCSVRIL